MFMGSISTFIYTSELILCSAPSVFIVLRGAAFICTFAFSSPRFTILNRPRLSLSDLVAQAAG